MPWLGPAMGAFSATRFNRGVAEELPIPPGETTIFDVTTYGATGNGTTNDAPAIQLAYTAARNNSIGGDHSTVYFPPGTYYITQRAVQLLPIRTNDWYGQTSPSYVQRGVIRFSGYGATIRYPSSSSWRFAFLQAIEYGTTPEYPTNSYAAGLYKTWGNLEIEGFTIDANNGQPSGDAGLIFWGQGCGNFDNITIRDITMPFRFLARTTYNQSSTIYGIMMMGWPASRLQSHTGYCKDIYIDDCVIHGQTKPIAILTPKYTWVINGVTYTSDNPLGWNPYTFVNLNINNVYTHNHHHLGTGIHLGSVGSGYSCTVTNCSCHDSSDNLIEIDAFNEVLVQGCEFTDASSAIGFTWFSYPYSTSTPNYQIRDCHYLGGANAYWPTTTVTEPAKRASQSFCQVTLGSASTQLRGREWGNFTFEDCTAITMNSTTEAYSSVQYPVSPGPNMWQPTIFLDSPLTSVRLNNIAITDTGGRGTSSTVDLAMVTQRSPGLPNIPVYIHGITYRTTDSGAFSLVPLAKWTVSGLTNIDTDIIGL